MNWSTGTESLQRDLIKDCYLEYTKNSNKSTKKRSNLMKK